MSYFKKYLKYKKKYLALKGGGEKKQAEECKKGKIDISSCPDENFPCLDDKSSCLSKKGLTLLQYLQIQENTVEDKTIVYNTSNYSLDSRGSKNFPKVLKNKVFEYNSCDDIIKYLSLNKSLINEIDTKNWKYLLGNIKVNGFDYEKVKKNFKNLAEINPKYSKKVEQDSFMLSFCDDGVNDISKKYCLIYYFKCIYKKLTDKYEAVDIDAWNKSILKGNVDDYKFFDYFINTTIIMKNAFEKEPSLESVIIPESVIIIGEGAFEKCSRLTSVILPEGLTSIGEDAFYRCTELTSVILPKGLMSIGDDAFSKCSGLTSIILPEGLTSIGEGAFQWCSGLTSVTFPKGLTSIGEGAFGGCTKLTSVTFPKVLTSIGKGAFQWCSGLTSVILPEGLTSIGYGAFEDCIGLASVTFPEGLTSTGEYAFLRCTELTSLTFPEGLTSIGKGAFDECTGLTSVTFPKGLTSIGERAFLRCTELTSLTFPEGLISIGRDAFRGCINLKTIKIPKKMIEMVRRAIGSGTIPNNVTISFSIPEADKQKIVIPIINLREARPPAEKQKIVIPIEKLRKALHPKPSLGWFHAVQRHEVRSPAEKKYSIDKLKEEIDSIFSSHY